MADPLYIPDSSITGLNPQQISGLRDASSPISVPADNGPIEITLSSSDIRLGFIEYSLTQNVQSVEIELVSDRGQEPVTDQVSMMNF